MLCRVCDYNIDSCQRKKYMNVICHIYEDETFTLTQNCIWGEEISKKYLLTSKSTFN